MVERVVLWPDEVDQPARIYPSSGRAFMERAYGGVHAFTFFLLDPGESATLSEYLADIPKGSGIVIPFHYEWEKLFGVREPYHLVPFDRRDIDRSKLPKECFASE